MLKLAIKAQLPLIAVTTRDTLNLPSVLKHVTGKAPVAFGTGQPKLTQGALYFHVCEKGFAVNAAQLYTQLVKHESSLVLVNPREPHPLVFACGEVPTPRKMLLEFMATVVDDLAIAEALLPALGGCTIKEAAEFARLTMARDRSLTAAGLMLTRKTCFVGASGLTQVDPHQIYYTPPPFLVDWTAKEKAFFLGADDPRLVPRGLLMDGPPGVGKTESSKYIATRFGVPLYRIDFGGVKYKYVGTSEANMSAVLSQLDHEEPCVALLDEIEKIFGHHDSSGVTESMLSQLLWWLAEHRSRVLTVMTTNDRVKLPPELYREGRVDEVMYFHGLEQGAATTFAKAVLETFPAMNKKWHAGQLDELVAQALKRSKLPTDPPTVAQAAVAKAIYDLVKVTFDPGQDCNPQPT